MNPPSDRICKTCADYITYYTDAGFKTSKLISQLEIVVKDQNSNA